MTLPKRLLFYTDAAEYGGHEAMTVEAVRHLCSRRDLQVSFIFYEGNERLLGRLEDIKNSSGNLALKPLPFRSKTLQAFRSLLTWIKTRRIEALMKQVDPDVVVISQGRIEASSLGLLAAKRAGLRTISYIPMAHPVHVSGKPFALWLREKVNGYFYRLPDKIITISEGARRMLLASGATPNVLVVPNGVEVRVIREPERERFREAHGIQRHDYAVAVVGRIDFRQKAQDFAVQAIARFRGELADCRFLFIGGGPDERQLRTMIANSDLTGRVQVLPWSDNPAEIFGGIDMLLIPSRFEGVPLVMLEAMSCRLPVVASDVDGMAELLPEAWLFPSGNSRAMIDTLLRVKNSDYAALAESNRDLVLREFSVTRFCMRFSEAVFA
jgi:glycosyltransferase involved in cell wall biosynthesis